MSHHLPTSNRSLRLALFLAMGLAGVALPITPVAWAQDSTPGQGSLSSANTALWDRQWSVFASRYTLHEGEFYPCAKYNPTYPSSLGVTPGTLVERNTRSRTVIYGGNISRQVRTVPSLADAKVAAAALPAVSFGEYGHIHSVEIVQVLGPKQMLVKQPWLIDAQALDEQIDKARERAAGPGDRNREARESAELAFQFRQQLADRQRQEDSFRSGGILLIGLETRGLEPGQRWKGPGSEGLDIAITGKKTIQYTRPASRSGSSTSRRTTARPREIEVTVALPVSTFEGRITRAQFNEMLASRGMTLAQFIDHCQAEQKRDADNAVFNAIRLLEAGRPAPASQADADDDKADDKPARRRSSSSSSRRAGRSSDKAADTAPADAPADDGL